jgi:hypothetical protein
MDICLVVSFPTGRPLHRQLKKHDMQMNRLTFMISLLTLVSATTFAQNRFSKGELSINGFRNPSIGLEYRLHNISIHGGYYLTNFESGVTTRFIKAGLTGWFLPVGKRENPSSFYAGASYLRGINRDYEDQNAFGVEAGFRWMVWPKIKNLKSIQHLESAIHFSFTNHTYVYATPQNHWHPADPERDCTLYSLHYFDYPV